MIYVHYMYSQRKIGLCKINFFTFLLSNKHIESSYEMEFKVEINY